jgi:hypothetical protein
MYTVQGLNREAVSLDRVDRQRVRTGAVLYAQLDTKLACKRKDYPTVV